ncbi:MAG: hypothetical protein ACI8QT_002071 [Halioglobus sp.]|jgi:hypothetical protein
MIKKMLTASLVLLVVAAGLYVFKSQLWDFTAKAITADMFVQADTDNFNPGIAIGEQFPDIHALYQGGEITDAGEFIHDKGMVFIANRSADW